MAGVSDDLAPKFGSAIALTMVGDGSSNATEVCHDLTLGGRGGIRQLPGKRCPENGGFLYTAGRHANGCQKLPNLLKFPSIFQRPKTVNESTDRLCPCFDR
jgi:hypothetical protein